MTKVAGGMKYIDEFRDGVLAKKIADRLAAEVRPGVRYQFSGKFQL